MSTRENITDILCIGCQKGSTSWLHSVINTHPATWAFPNSEPVTSTTKEAHFWDWNHQRGIDWYRQLMTPPDPALRTLDFTPEYAGLSDRDIAECKALNPTARVIYILRDPLARAVSGIRMQMLWHLGKDRTEPLHLDADFDRVARLAKLGLHGDYLRNVRAWRRHYPELILLNYEDFHTDRAGSVARIFSELGLDQAGLDEAGQERLQRLMRGRVWASEPFAMDRSVLMTLHGLTWRFRQEAEEQLGMRFAEGERLLKE
ncbi:MAG: sulfotransferase domain-containing protein [Rhodobacter sp.]|nr:sulfotransferase domain-containing protein [Paracoccaceae bacterium]MCC0076753.1 sulfotransferase domain-containing protein [Rhodobacter sp.]